MRILLLISIAILLSRCNEPHPEKAVFLSELGIWVDQSEVTVIEFKEFKNYFEYHTQTDSLKTAKVFSDSLLDFIQKPRANFLFPNGVQEADSLWPVTQISWEDACAYCNAVNGRLPTAEEWEYMASGDFLAGNIWEGYFPIKDEGLDGFKAIPSPVKSFKKNAHNLYDIYGNVREWTASVDGSGKVFVKGGSFLTDYNSGAFLPDYKELFQATATQNDLGFRCVYDF